MAYNGWKNYETWNVALWLGNDQALYAFAKRHKGAYTRLAELLVELWGPTTPDGVRWLGGGLDRTALTRMLKEL